MPVSLIAPDADNYQVGKGIVSFKPEGAADFIDLGNVAELEYTPTIEKLDHFSSRTGTRSKDKSIVQTRGGTLRLLMEEMTATNLSMLLLGTVDDAAVEGPTVEIFAVNSMKGEVKFEATNDVGPRWDLHFWNVEFSPSGSFNPISEEWNQIEVTGEVLVSQEPPNEGKVGTAVLTNLPPTTPLSRTGREPRLPGGRAGPAREPNEPVEVDMTRPPYSDNNRT